MSLADMDFRAPDEVREALVQRAAHGVYGYTVMDSNDIEAVRQWTMARRRQQVPATWLFPTHGVV